MQPQSASGGLSEPPEGVIAGESVPRENEEDDIDRQLIEEVMGELKGRGEPYISMNDSELREKAREAIRSYGVDL